MSRRLRRSERRRVRMVLAAFVRRGAVPESVYGSLFKRGRCAS
jgi:hypothetical protein